MKVKRLFIQLSFLTILPQNFDLRTTKVQRTFFVSFSHIKRVMVPEGLWLQGLCQLAGEAFDWSTYRTLHFSIFNVRGARANIKFFCYIYAKFLFLIWEAVVEPHVVERVRLHPLNFEKIMF